MTRAEESELARFHAEERAHTVSLVLGRYSVGQATIHLSKWVEVFRDDGSFDPDADPRHVAVLLHEYLHYLHNYSTIVGVEQTLATLALTTVFARTLDQAGSGLSAGQAVLNPRERELLERLVTARHHFVGSESNADVFDGASSLRVVRWASVGGQLGVFFTPQLDVVVEGGPNAGRATTLVLSSLVIEESLAAIWERLYLRSQGIALPAATRPYPYEIAGWVARHFHPELEDEEVFRLGCIALNATNPGEQFMLLLQEKLEMLRAEDFLERIGWADIYPRARAVALRKLDEIESVFVGRGLAEHGISSAFERARQLLERRVDEPWFELRLRDGVLDVEATNALVQSTVPCEVVQARTGGSDEVGRDHILAFGGDSDKNIEGRRVVQLMVHAMTTHATRAGELVASAGRARPCPYFTSCVHARRRDRPDLCATTPWVPSTPKGSQRCWYEWAMLSLVAKVRILDE